MEKTVTRAIYTNTDYLNNVIDMLKYHEDCANEIINRYLSKGMKPSLTIIREEYNALQRHLYKSQYQLEQIEIYKKAITHIQVIGMKLFLETM